MFRLIRKWFGGGDDDAPAKVKPVPRRPVARQRPVPPKKVDPSADKLSLLDDDNPEAGNEPGLDPYNTGRFDRSKNWDKRFRN